VKRPPTADEPREHSAALHLSTSPAGERTPPSWLTEAILLLRVWWSRWTLLPLVEGVRLERGRAGTFELLDFVLVLLAYAVSGAPTLEDFYDQVQPGAASLMGVWMRHQMPSRSALSRALQSVTDKTVDALRALFLTCWSRVRAGPCWEGFSIGRAAGTSSSTLMAPVRSSANARSLRERIGRPPVGAPPSSPRLAIPDASAARSCARV
jgi:hypothetical protein